MGVYNSDSNMNNTGSLISNACYMYMYNTCIVLATTISCSETVHIVGETKRMGLLRLGWGVAMVMNRVLLSGSKSAMEC